MKIEREDFIMESTDPNNTYCYNWFFDLQLLKTVKGKQSERKEFKLEGYSIVVPYCIELIAKNRTSDKESYQKECESLYKEFEELGLKMKMKKY